MIRRVVPVIVGNTRMPFFFAPKHQVTDINTSFKAEPRRTLKRVMRFRNSKFPLEEPSPPHGIDDPAAFYCVPLVRRFLENNNLMQTIAIGKLDILNFAFS